ncbi:MAG: DUF72 domain-containing protein [Deltaproteobacteria bacterium]|nr:DUF72 domain-containing protein [Deltaproteobacteria bacterium]
MTNILIGTSGFSYQDWHEVFYPKEMDPKDYLTFYSHQFQVLELNFSYYRIPDARLARQMLVNSEERMEFVIKANRQMTHEISNRSLSEILPLFMKGISPFIEAGKMGAVLLQFPQGFHYLPANRVYLKSLIEALAPIPAVVEFRQKEWLRESVFKSLKDLNAGFVCVDEPALPALIPPMFIHTSRIGYVRFHGRNKKNWYGTDATKRYDYLYSNEELREWVPRIRKLAEDTDKLYVFFNNHARAQAVNNARMLINMLERVDRNYS